MQIINFGANIGYVRSDHSQHCQNLKTAHQYSSFTSSTVKTMVENCHLAGPFPNLPFSNFCTSPIGVVSCKCNPVKLQIINHLSWPTSGTSANDGIADSEAAIQYDQFEKAIEDLIQSGPWSLMVKLDLKDAFQHIPVWVQGWKLLGLHWEGQFYYLLVLTFGLHNAPYILNLFTEALHWIIQQHIPAVLYHYLDDFFLNFSADTPLASCYVAIKWVMALGQQLGLNFQLSKMVWPAHVIEFLGLILDSIWMEAHLLDNKLLYLTSLLAKWETKWFSSLTEVQELSGYLQFCYQVIPHSRSFLCCIFDFQSKFNNSFTKLCIPSSVKSNIVWWPTFSKHWNGVQLLQPLLPSLDLYTDVSSWKGLSGVFGHRWFASHIAWQFWGRNIQFKELYAIVQSILCWGNEWSGLHIVFHCNNQAVVDWLSSGTCHSVFSMPLVQLVTVFATYLCFSFSCVWVSSLNNALADTASCFQ